MKRFLYILLILGFTWNFCCSSVLRSTSQKSYAYITCDISKCFQDHFKLFDVEDFEPDFDDFCKIDNVTIYFPDVNITLQCQTKRIIYIRHLILAFISDIPPPCFFIL